MKFGITASSRPEARLYDESGTEVDEDVFEDVLKQANLGVFQLRLENSLNSNGECDITLCLSMANGNARNAKQSRVNACFFVTRFIKVYSG